MRSIILAAAMFAMAAPAAVYAADAPKFSTAVSTIDALKANPDAMAVLQKHLPQISQAPAEMGTQTLKQVQSMAPDRITDKLLADIDADLAKIK